MKVVIDEEIMAWAQDALDSLEHDMRRQKRWDELTSHIPRTKIGDGVYRLDGDAMHAIRHELAAID